MVRVAEKHILALPDDLKAQLGVRSGLEVEVHMGTDELIIQSPKPVEAKKQRWGMIVLTILMTCVFVGYFLARKIYSVSLVGSESVATMVLMLTTLSGLISFSVVFIRLKRTSGSVIEAISWRNFPTVALAFTLISFMVMAGLFWIAGQLFKGATFDLMTSTALFIVITLIDLLAINSIVPQLSSRLLTNIFIAVIVSGVILAMISNQNLYWWKHSLCFLGTNKAYAAWEFNLVLIFSGLILIALVDYLFVSLKRVFPKSRPLLVLRILLTLLAVDLAFLLAFSWLVMLFERLNDYLEPIQVRRYVVK